MLSVSDAQTEIRRQARPLSPRLLPLTSAALDLVLAEDVASDVDMPPYDKALMDGYAVRGEDLDGGRGVLEVIEEINAGMVPSRALAARQATRIMTGAPIPSGADAVVMVERTRMRDDRYVAIEDPNFKPLQNILERGREFRCGAVVAASGTRLRPQELGLLAAVGRSEALLFPQPDVAILPTGDEIVEPSEPLGPGQIRNSNAAVLLALTERAGAKPRYLGIGRDRLESLRPLVRDGLTASILVLAGGVSAGKRDLVPEVLAEAGVEARFHKVEMKPGKPMFFGTRGQTLVFGLPGNPVSAFVCFELFVRPAIRILRGEREAGPRITPAILNSDFAYKTDRPTFYPVVVSEDEGRWIIRPVPWFGSADLKGLCGTNGFACLEPGDHRYTAGQVLPVLRIED
jgi:molybdopterin molybdotransferase